jgi:CubicO group peptidase (beta-lactamase class C family)
MTNLAVPESVGLSSARLSKIGNTLQGMVDRKVLAGAIALVHRRGRTAYCECRGFMDLEARRPMTEDTIFRFYSMSKPVTAVAMLTLFEDGLFQLDEPVSAFLPEFASCKVLRSMGAEGPELEDLSRPVTIRHLFTHTSGFCYPAPNGAPVARLMAEAMNGPSSVDMATASLEEWTARLVKAPLAHQPGAGWTYGFSIDVLGRLVEVMSGKAFDEFLRDRIFDPLGMEDTDFYVPKEKHARLAKVYSLRKEGGLEVVEWSNDAFWKKPRFLSGGGGLVSTASDYLRFARMLLAGGELDGHRVLGRRTVRLMASCHVPQLMDLREIMDRKPFGPGCTFGLGGRVVADETAGLYGSVGSYSWDGLAGTTFWVDPKEDLIGLFLPQMIPGPPQMNERIRTFVYQALT